MVRKHEKPGRLGWDSKNRWIVIAIGMRGTVFGKLLGHILETNDRYMISAGKV